jgi:hypothetical protein
MALRPSILLMAATSLATSSAVAATPDYARAMCDIAHDIAVLKHGFPQLAEFKPQALDGLKITYAFRTHPAPHSGGWTSGVPNPDNDGVWFYIDMHDADSTAEIHTQPMTVDQCIGDKRVSFLILEGDATRSLSGEIEKILRNHGIGRCNRPHRAPAGVAARIT